MTESLSAGDSPHGAMQLETDREARFRAIYDREFTFVWSAAKYFGVPAAARDDVVQDVFLTAYRRLDQVHYQVSARAWLYGVTRRVASHYHRGTARRSRRLAALGDVTSTSGEAPHERHDAARLLERLLERLPRGTREVWELTELLGMSGPGLAAELELPLNTVYSRLRLARARLLELAASPDLLAAEIAAARRREAPAPAAASRTWALMVPLLGPGKLTAIAAAWASARAGVMTTLVVAGTAAVVVAAPARRAAEVAGGDLSRETSAPARRAASDGEGAADLSGGTAEAGLAGGLSFGTGVARVEGGLSGGTGGPGLAGDMSGGTAGARLAGGLPLGTGGAGLESGLSRRTGGSRLADDMSLGTAGTGLAGSLSRGTGGRELEHGLSRGTGGAALDERVSRETSARAPAGDDLAAEVALLDRARAHLDAGEPAAAALLLGVHAREFPRGALVDAREAAGVEVLCLQGRRDEAAAAARRLAARLPESVLAPRLERSVCAGDGSAGVVTEPAAAGDEPRWR